jgi:hypothetical protein
MKTENDSAAKAVTTKEEEISALRALVSMDGYFAETFGGDVEKMIENIRNDFPIEMDTKITNRADQIKERYEALILRLKEDIMDLCDILLCQHDETDLPELYMCVVEKVGQTKAIIRKRALKLKITDNDVDYLLKEINMQ